MLRDPTLAALVGVVLGAMLSVVSGLVLLQAQRRSQERYEVWIRLLNSYQDFPNFARQMLAFAEGQDELFEAAAQGAHKAANDAATLDPYGNERVERMRSILAAIQGRPSLSDTRRIEVEKEIDAVYQDFVGDRRLKFRRFR